LTYKKNEVFLKKKSRVPAGNFIFISRHRERVLVALSFLSGFWTGERMSFCHRRNRSLAGDWLIFPATKRGIRIGGSTSHASLSGNMCQSPALARER
jgi:hypothetical protein